MMKRRTTFTLAAFALAALLALAAISTALAQAQPGYSPGPGGMMGGRGPTGQGYGPGMMGGGGMMRGWGTTSPHAQSINSLDDAKQAFQRYIDATGNGWWGRFRAARQPENGCNIP